MKIKAKTVERFNDEIAARNRRRIEKRKEIERMAAGKFNGYSEQYAVGFAMVRYGGGFMEGLGRALQNADDENSRLIRETWSDDYARYMEMAKGMEQFQDGG